MGLPLHGCCEEPAGAWNDGVRGWAGVARRVLGRARAGLLRLVVTAPKTWKTRPRDFTVTAVVPELGGAQAAAKIASPPVQP